MQKQKIFYGWVIVASLLLLTSLPMVFISNFFSYYQVPVSQELGCDYVQFSTTNIFNTIAGILFGVLLAGKVCGGNIRLAMAVGGVGTAAACFAQSFVTAIWQFWIVGFVINIFMSCFTYTPINFLLSRWFVEKKGLATSIVFAGGGLGGAIFSKPFANILAANGWRFCYRMTALIALVVVLLVALIVRKDPAEKGTIALGKKEAVEDASQAAIPQIVGLTKAEAVKSASFYLYAGALVCVGMTAAGVMTHVPTYLIEAELDYAAIMAIYSTTSLFAQILSGFIYDKLGMSKGIGFNVSLAIIGMIFMILVMKMRSGAAYAAMVFVALSGGLGSLAAPMLTGRCFGNKDFGSIYGLGNSLFMAGCMIGPMLSATIRETSGSYLGAWAAYVAVYAGIFIFGMLAVKTSPLNKK